MGNGELTLQLDDSAVAQVNLVLERVRDRDEKRLFWRNLGQRTQVGLNRELAEKLNAGVVHIAERKAHVEGWAGHRQLRKVSAHLLPDPRFDFARHVEGTHPSMIMARIGDTLRVGINPAAVYLFDAKDRAIGWPTQIPA